MRQAFWALVVCLIATLEAFFDARKYLQNIPVKHSFVNLLGRGLLFVFISILSEWKIEWKVFTLIPLYSVAWWFIFDISFNIFAKKEDILYIGYTSKIDRFFHRLPWLDGKIYMLLIKAISLIVMVKICEKVL